MSELGSLCAFHSEDAGDALAARVINGTATRADVDWLAQSLEVLAAEHNELIVICLEEHHIATGGPRAGQMIHSDCAICEWLANHPRRQA